MNPSFTFLCAEAATPQDFGIDWSVVAIVLVGVAALMFVIRGVGLLAARSLPEPGAKPVPRKAKPAAASAEDDAITDELVAVLTAAATSTLGRPVRILEIAPGRTAAQQAWSQEGRREIYLSHRFR